MEEGTSCAVCCAVLVLVACVSVSSFMTQLYNLTARYKYSYSYSYICLCVEQVFVWRDCGGQTEVQKRGKNIVMRRCDNMLYFRGSLPCMSTITELGEADSVVDLRTLVICQNIQISCRAQAYQIRRRDLIEVGHNQRQNKTANQR